MGQLGSYSVIGSKVASEFHQPLRSAPNADNSDNSRQTGQSPISAPLECPMADFSSRPHIQRLKSSMD